MDDLISRQAAIEQVLAGKLSDDSLVECVEECNSMLEWTVDVLKKLPSVQPEVTEEAVKEYCRKRCLCIVDSALLKKYASAQPDCSDCIEHGGDWECDHVHCHKGKSAQPTLYGYNIEHLELIARVLQKEDLPPERIVEALTDIGRIVAIVKDEFEETLRKAVEQCMT